MGLKKKIKSELERRIEMCRSLAPKKPNPLDINLMGMLEETYMSVIRYVDTIEDEDDDIEGDLEEVAQKYEDYFDVDDSQEYLCTHRGDLKDAVIHGANWQKGKTQKLIDEASNIVKNEVAKKIMGGVVELMGGVVECEIVGKDDESTTVKVAGSIPQASVGETMKVVLIKKD